MTTQRLYAFDATPVMTAAALRSAVHQVTTTILNPYDLPDLLHCLTDHVVAVADAAGAGIMPAGRGGGKLGFAASSDERAVQVEVMQDRIEAGPCVEAYETGRIGCVEDLARASRWPEYEQRAIELGFRSVLAVPPCTPGEGRSGCSTSTAMWPDPGATRTSRLRRY